MTDSSSVLPSPPNPERPPSEPLYRSRLAMRFHRLLRRIPVRWRIFVIVVINTVMVVVLGIALSLEDREIAAQWEENRHLGEDGRLYAGIDREISQLQGLIHRYLTRPDQEILEEINARRTVVLGRLEALSVPAVADSAAEMTRSLMPLRDAARLFLDGFDRLKSGGERMRQIYELEMLAAATEMSGLYVILDSASRQRNPLIAPVLARSREAFSAAVLSLTALYLGDDHAAAQAAEERLLDIASALPVMADLTSDTLQYNAVKALESRCDVLLRGVDELVALIQERQTLMQSAIDGAQKQMATEIDALLERGRKAQDQAGAGFSEELREAQVLVLMIFAGFLLLSIGVSAAIGLSIRRPLARLQQAMIAIAAGDYHYPVGEGGARDEIGEMARAVAVFKANAIVKQQIEREREVQERRWRVILESSPVGISILTLNTWQRLYTNPQYDRLFGFASSAEACASHTTESFCDPEDLNRIFQELQQTGQVVSYESHRRRANGETWWCLLDARPIDYAGHQAAIAWHYDVTRRREAENEIREAKERAEKALAELREAQESLIQAEKMASLGGLVAGVAHEINTPIGTTLTAASLLHDETRHIRRLQGDGNLKRKDFERYLELAGETSERIQANCIRAAELIQSFKQVAVDQTSEERRRFVLADYIQEVLISLGPRLRRTALKVEVDGPPELDVDGYPGLLAQVITNFIMNSIMHGYQECQPGTVRFTFRLLPPDDVELIYRDDGRGISPENLSRIFDPFFTTNRGGGGTGLGLNIVYNIVQQKLKGAIRAESQPGQGAAFILRFPRTLTPDAPPKPENAGENP